MLDAPLQLAPYPGSPVVSFLVGLVIVVLLLVYFDLPAFIGLIIAAFAIGLVTPQIALGNIASKVATSFGNNMAGIGIPILMAAVIGTSLTESGAAIRIVRAFNSLTGEERSHWSLFGSSYVLAIPVFFDNVWYLLAPIAKGMRARMGKNYTLYVAAVSAGGVTAHGFIAPTPGPLAVSNRLGVSLGIEIIVGVIVAIPTAIIAGIVYGHWINRRLDIPLRETSVGGEDLEEEAQRALDELPGLFESLLPIIIAVVFIASGTIVSAAVSDVDPWVKAITSFVGNPNFAMTAAAIVAAITYFRVRDIERSEWSDKLTESLRTGGNIAAITCAGGAFGAMLAAAGIGDFLAGHLSNLGFGLLVTAWVIAAIVRLAQGSATVALITTAGIVEPLMGQLSVHPVYLVLAIGAGGTFFSWYNDSGFWIVNQIGGLTERETFEVWTAVTTIVSVVGLIIVLIMSSVFPLT